MGLADKTQERDGLSILVFLGLLNLVAGGYLASHELAALGLPLVALAIVLLGIAVASAVASRRATKRLLTTVPTVPSPLATSGPDLFDEQKVALVDEPLPHLPRGVRHFFANQKAVSEHRVYLEGVVTQASAAVPPAIAKYKEGACYREQQQIVLYRLAHQAAAAAARLQERFPTIRGDLTSVPAPTMPATPLVPSIITVADHDRRVSTLEKASINALARAGLEGARGNLFLATVTVAATAAVNVVQFQRMVRQLADDHGRVKAYAIRARQDLAELGRAHREILNHSQAIHAKSIQLHALLLWATQQIEGVDGDAPAAEAAFTERMTSLMSYALLARLDTARAI